ncbi:ribbon-helix-helix protein, CopG family [Methylolobus aquaticus]
MSTLSIRLPEALERQLQEEARKADKTRSELVRDIVAEYLTRLELERFMAELAQEARQGYADAELRREALELAEDFLPLEQVVIDQPRALDRDRIGEGPLVTLTTGEMEAVERSLRAVLGM